MITRRTTAEVWSHSLPALRISTLPIPNKGYQFGLSVAVMAKEVAIDSCETEKF